MSIATRLHRLIGRARLRPPTRRPAVEALEDRTVPSTLTVVTNADSGAGSLRALIASADPGDTITFARTVNHITLTSGELLIPKSLTIQGPGANKLTISGNDASRVFDISSGAVTISGLTVTDGLADASAPGKPSAGGGLLNRTGANLTLSRVSVENNRAVGDPGVILTTTAVFNLVGGAVGGGLANFGTLIVNDSTFRGNLARGADNADSSAFSFPGPAFAGHASGGAISSYATATLTRSTFTDNVSRAGSLGKGDFAAVASSGAVYNDFQLTVIDSTFRHNQAIGGDDSVSPFHNGHGLGGAIMSGSLLPVIGGPGGSLTVHGSTFEHNEAIGGNDNIVLLPPALIPKADGPNSGYGGGILVYQGSATIHRSTLQHNRAVGGDGGGDKNGSLGVGGGLFLFSFLGGVTATVSDCTIRHNIALGGDGRYGGRGGDGLGGGIAVGSLGAPFGGPGTATISGTALTHNVAQGGHGGVGGDGGDGLGGGLFNDAGSTLSVATSRITHNQARAGQGKGGGSDGQGIGGGIYNLGSLAVDLLTVLAKNLASTSDDDCFGC